MDAAPLALPVDDCRRVLAALLDQVPHIRGAVLCRSDGFEVTGATRGTVPVSRLSALSSSMVALGQASLREIGLAGGGTVLIEGGDGKLLLLEVPSPVQPLVLAVVGSGELVTGTLLWAARDCVARLLPLITPTTP